VLRSASDPEFRKFRIMKLRVAFAGTPAFAVPALLALAESHTLVGVLTQPDRPAGRGRVLSASHVKRVATELGLPIMQPARLRADDPQLAATLATLDRWQADVLVVVAYGLLLPQAILQQPHLGCLNIHGSLLPRWRGAAPIQRAILAGDRTTGVCIMQMNQGLDTGDIWRQAAIDISPLATADSLHEQLANIGAQQILLALDDIVSGTRHAVPQASDGVTYAAKLSKTEAEVDWSNSAVQIDRQIRGLNPWPMAQSSLRGEVIKFLRSSVATEGVDNTAARPNLPGAILALEAEGLRVACGRGVVHIHELQRAGRRPIAARDFYNGIAPSEQSALSFQ
jgi:methionyl-tRNA formyltransferase